MTDDERDNDVFSPFILDVLGVDLYARAIMDYVPIGELVRSERVCRQWQRAVHKYLQTQNLSFFDVQSDGQSCFNTDDDNRTITITHKIYSLSLVRIIIDKWGASIVQIITNYCEEEYFDIIASKCFNLQHIKFRNVSSIGLFSRYPLNQIRKCKKIKRISFINFNIIFFGNASNQDLLLGKVFQNANCEIIQIEYNHGLTGRFLEYTDSSRLKCIILNQCSSLDIRDLQSSIFSFRNVTRLNLDENPISIFSNVHLLLKGTPKLEELSLRDYGYTDLKEEFLNCFSRLCNLKQLSLTRNGSVNSDLLEAVSGSLRLELLDIRGINANCSAGVAKLCRRRSVTLCLGCIKNYHYRKESLLNYVRDMPFVQQLEEMGCVEVTPEWLDAACIASQNRKHRLEINAKSSTDEIDGSKNLKIVLYE